MKLLCHVALVPYSVFHGVLSGAGDEFITLQDLSFSFHPKSGREKGGRNEDMGEHTWKGVSGNTENWQWGEFKWRRKVRGKFATERLNQVENVKRTGRKRDRDAWVVKCCGPLPVMLAGFCVTSPQAASPCVFSPCTQMTADINLHTHTHTRTHRNSLLSLHHCYYGNIKAWWHLIFSHFLQLN